MSLVISKPYLTGENPLSLTLADSNWHTVSREGNLYDTEAALIAAADHVAGNYGFGAKGMEVMINSVTNTGADGSVVGFKVNATATPTTVDQADDYVSGSGQKLVWEGPFRNLWIKGTSGDRVKLVIRY